VPAGRAGGKNSHGVRKAAATRLAQRGASTHMLMATFGWLSIAQAELYTRDVERKGLSHEASPMMGMKRGDRKSLTLDPPECG
jgi:integrase